jgi:hypothetical protein
VNSLSSRKYLRAIFSPLTSRGIVTDAELRMIIELIEGLAIEQPIGTLSHCGAETILSRPLLIGLMLLTKNGPVTDTPKDLLAKIGTELRLHGTRIDDPSFPITEDALGRQLSLLIADADELGLVIIRNANERPRTWTIYRKEDGPRGGSVCAVSVPPQDSGGTSNESDTKTAADTTLREILALRFSPSSPVPGPTDPGQSRNDAVEVRQNGER